MLIPQRDNDLVFLLNLFINSAKLVVLYSIRHIEVAYQIFGAEYSLNQMLTNSHVPIGVSCFEAAVVTLTLLGWFQPFDIRYSF